MQSVPFRLGKILQVQNTFVRIKSSSTSSEPMTIPYSLTLDYDGDEKTARVGVEDDSYPYDFWIAVVLNQTFHYR